MFEQRISLIVDILELYHSTHLYFLEFPMENQSEDDIDLYNLLALSVSDLPTIDTYNEITEPMQ
jgi:hypothetical protein